MALRHLVLLLQLPSFDIVSSIGIDTMHCVYLGVVKQLVGLWFNSKHNGQRWYCGNNIERVDKRLLEIKPPSVVTRIPRSIYTPFEILESKRVPQLAVVLLSPMHERYSS